MEGCRETKKEKIMEFFRRDFKEDTFTLYPIGDFHYGSEQCDVNFIKKVVKEIQHDPLAYWVGMGDFIENAIPGSPGGIYEQIVSPGKHQIDDICEILLPIARKGLFLIAGNHEARTRRNTGMIPEELIAFKLDLPYKGFSCLSTFQLSKTNISSRIISCYFHHNYGGGYTKGGKINRAEQLRLLVPTADAIFSGHFHITSRIAWIWYDTAPTHIRERIGYDYIIGSALKWNGSYAEEKGKPAAVREFIKVNFKISRSTINGVRDWIIRQKYQVIQPEEEIDE